MLQSDAQGPAYTADVLVAMRNCDPTARTTVNGHIVPLVVLQEPDMHAHRRSWSIISCIS